jgi:hypothetical protein
MKKLTLKSTSLNMVSRLFFTLILLMSFYSGINGQHLQIQWQQCYGGSDADIAYDIVSTDSGYIIAGMASSSDGDITNYHGGEDDVWIVRTDEYGNLMWEKTYGGTGSEGAYRIFRAENSNNDFYLVGGSNSSDGDISNDPYEESLDYWIVKIDSAGNKLWDKIVGGNGWEQIWTGTPTSDGGIAAFGWSSSDDGDVSNAYGLFDMWMIKLDSMGQKQWDQSIGTSGFEYGQAIIETSDNGFLVGGTSRIESGGNIDCDPYSYKAEAILFKLDSEGNEEWQQCYGGSGDEGILGLLEVEDGYLFSAYANSSDGDLEGSGYHGTDDIWLVKTDFEGNIIWQKCFGGSNSEFANVMFQTSDEGLMVFGITSSKNGDVVGNHSSVETNYSIWVFKINNTGELLWQQCIGGISSEKIQFGVLQKSDHDYVIAGQMSYSPSYDVDCQNHQGDYEYWLFEVIDTTVSVAETKKEDGFNVYPNPANEKFKVSSPMFVNEKYQLEIVDLFGRKVKELQIPKGQTEVEVDAAGWKAGMYLIIFKKQGKIVAREKLVINQ